MVSILKAIPIFSSLKDVELEAIMLVSRTKHCPKETVILMEDEEGDTLFIILSGKVKVSSFPENGREVIFSMLGAGEFFGDMSLLDGRPRSATVIAQEDSDLRLLRRVDFHRAIEKYPSIALKLLEGMALRLRKADQRIESLATLDVTGRIAGILLQLAEERGTFIGKEATITGRPTHQELANMIGTTRETVTRVLKQMVRRGYIITEGKNIHIKNLSAFRRDLFLS